MLCINPLLVPFFFILTFQRTNLPFELNGVRTFYKIRFLNFVNTQPWQAAYVRRANDFAL